MQEENLNQFYIEEITKVINQHGYALQYSSLSKLHELYDNDKTEWVFVASELPVNLLNSGFDTRIDYILKKKDEPIYLIVECKRVNPAYSNWCFLKVPFIHRNYSKVKFIVDSITLNNDTIQIKAQKAYILEEKYVFNLGMVFKSKKKGDDSGRKDAIEDAANQVCKCSNGFIETIYKNSELINIKLKPENKKTIIIPIIITTAKLFAANVNLADANIENGTVSQDQIKIEEMDYIYYQYHQSEGIRQGYYNEIAGYDNIPKLFEQKYIRTIPIISAKNIESFMSRFHLDLDYFENV